MGTVYKVGSKCYCGGVFEDNTTADGLPKGMYAKCNKCRRQALDPDLVKQYKKEQEKKGASQ